MVNKAAEPLDLGDLRDRPAFLHDGRPTMSATLASSHDTAANPLDIMEQIVIANDWACDRRSDSEMAAEAPGRWCDPRLLS